MSKSCDDIYDIHFYSYKNYLSFKVDGIDKTLRYIFYTDFTTINDIYIFVDNIIANKTCKLTFGDKYLVYSENNYYVSYIFGRYMFERDSFDLPIYISLKILEQLIEEMENN